MMRILSRRIILSLLFAMGALGAACPAIAAGEAADARFLLGEPTKELCEFFVAGYRQDYEVSKKELDAFVKDKDVGQRMKASIERELKGEDRITRSGKNFSENLVDFIRRYKKMSVGLDPEQLAVLQSRMSYDNRFVWLANYVGNEVSRADCPRESWGMSDPKQSTIVDEYLRKGIVTFSRQENHDTLLGKASRETKLSMHIDDATGEVSVKIESSKISLPPLARFDDYSASRFKQDKLEDCIRILELKPAVEEPKRSDSDVKATPGEPEKKSKKRRWWQRKDSTPAR